MMKKNEKAVGNKNLCGMCCTKIRDISVTRDGKEILKDVSLHIHCGELTALIGPNGAGKTTLLKAILGEVKHKGQVEFVDETGERTGRPRIGYVPQQLSFDTGLPVSVLDLFAACRTGMPVWIFHPAKTVKEVKNALSLVDAAHLAKRKLGELSGGELQRVLLALALAPLPDLLLLDEPVSGVDINGMELFYNLVSGLRKAYDLSIILVSHDLPLIARYADRVVFLNRSVQCTGTPEEIFNDEKVVKVFGRIDTCGNMPS